MPVKIKCPSCSRSLQIKERMLGKSIRCPACEASFTAPDEVSARTNGSPGEHAAENASQRSSTPGQIGRFRIAAALGQGGFGTVYKAHDPVLEREVAIKVPRHGTKGAERLILEAKAAAPLRHPNIVAVYEAGADGDDLFIATEYVDGHTLATHCQQHPADQTTAAQLVKSLAEALAYAHQENVVHRDVKPQNVMISATGRAQLMDFGLARSAADEVSASDGVVGTPAYMSPEQARGDASEIGPASDQYSLGCVLYELLTKQPPFTGGADTISQLAAGKTAQRPRAIEAGIHRDLEAVCMKAMASEPKNRYTDCRAMADDLGRWLNDELVKARRYSPLELLVYWARKRPAMFGWATAAGFLVALLIGGGTAYGIHIMTAKTEPPSTNTAELNTRQVATNAAATNASNSEVSRAEAEMIRYGRLLDRTRYSLRKENVVRADRWLEDTRWDLRNWEYNYLRRVVTGGWKTIYGHFGEITALAVHPDGKRFASASTDGSVRVWQISTGGQLAVLNASHTVTSLAYSPDGNILAMATGVAGEIPSQTMYAMPTPMIAPAVTTPAAEGAEASPPVAATPAAQAPSAARATQFIISLRDASSLEEVGVYREHTGPIRSLVFSPDGTMIASGGAGAPAQPAPGQDFGPAPLAGDGRLWRVDSKDTEHRLSAPAGPIRRLAFSADGKRIVGVCGNGGWGEMTVWNIDPSAPVPPSSAGPPIAPPNESADNDASAEKPTDVLMPEWQSQGSYAAIAVSPYMGGNLVAAPMLDLWLLEQNRRRIAGDIGSVLTQQLAPGGGENKLHGPWSAVHDLVYSGEPSSFGYYTLAMAGGEALHRTSPGSVTLHDPMYQHGGDVSHLGHTAACTAVAFRADGKQFISGSADGVIKIWTAEVHPEVVRVGPQRTSTRVAFGKDGRYVAVADRAIGWAEPAMGAISTVSFNQPAEERPRGSVTLFDIRNGKEVLKLDSGPGDVLGLTMDPGMQWVAAGGDDRIVYVWNLETGVVRFKTNTGRIVRHLAVSADGKYLAAACGDRNPFGQSSGHQLQPPPVAMPASPAPIPIALNDCGPQQEPPQTVPSPLQPERRPPAPHGQMLQGEVIVWDASTGNQIARWNAHDKDALCVAFSPDGKQLVSAGADRTVKLWTIETQKELQMLEAFEGEILDLSFRQDGKEIAGAGNDPCRPVKPGEAVVWNVKDGKQRLHLSSHSGLIYSVAYSPDGKRLVTGGGGYRGSRGVAGEVKVWDAETGVELLPLDGPPGRTQKTHEGWVHYTVDVPHVITRQVTETMTRKVPKTGDDGQTIYEDVEVIVCKPVHEMQMRQETRQRMISHQVQWEEPGAVLGVAFSGDGRAIAAACEDGSALIWDGENCQPNDTAHWNDGNLICAAASPDGKWIATAGDSGDHCNCRGLVRIFDATTGRLAKQIISSTGTVVDIAFTADSNRIVTVGGAGAWNPSTCTIGVNMVPLEPEIYQNFFQAQQAADKSGRAVVWDIVTGKRVELPIGKAMPRCVVTSSRNDLALVGSDDGSIQLLDLKSAKSLESWSTDSPVIALAMHSDSNQFAAATASGKVWLGGSNSTGSQSKLKLVSDQVPGASDVAFDGPGKTLLVLTTEFAQANATASSTTASSTTASSTTASSTTASIQLASNSTTRRSRLFQWNLETLAKPSIFSLTGSAKNMAIDQSGKWIAVGGWDSSVTLLEMQSGKQMLRLAGHRAEAQALALKDGRIASASADHTIKVWDVQQSLSSAAECAYCSPPHARTIEINTAPEVIIRNVRFSRDGKVAAVGGHVIRMTSVQPPASEPPASEPPASEPPASEPPASEATAMDTPTSSEGTQQPQPPQPPQQTQPQPQQEPTYEGVVSLHQPETGQLIDTISVLNAPNPEFDLSSDGRYVAIARQDKVVVVWDRNEKKSVAECVHPELVSGISFRPTADGQPNCFATSCADGKVRIWSVDGMEQLALPHNGPVSCVLFNATGKILATGDGQQNAYLWDVEKQQILHTLSGHEGEVCALSFSGDGQFLAATSRRGTDNGWTGDLKVWEVKSGKRTLAIPTHTWWAAEIAFHPRLPHVATTGKDHTVQMYHAKTGELLLSIPTFGYLCDTMSFSPDGKRLLVQIGGRAKLIDPTPEPRPFGHAPPSTETTPSKGAVPPPPQA